VTQVNGMPQSSNNTRLDGATISYPWLPRLVAYLPPVEAVETVGQPYFDPLAFAPVTDVRFGNSGRNILRGPGLFNLDGSVFRTFKVSERFNLQFRAECFGATNTPQFGNPGTTVSSLTKNLDLSIKALNGYTEITSAGGERNFRFALKLSF
jgi:hypothetical protein